MTYAIDGGLTFPLFFVFQPKGAMRRQLPLVLKG